MTISKELLDELLKGVERPEDLLGDAGLMKELKIRLMERMLGAELTEHLGYEHGEVAPQLLIGLELEKTPQPQQDRAHREVDEQHRSGEREPPSDEGQRHDEDRHQGLVDDRDDCNVKQRLVVQHIHTR